MTRDILALRDAARAAGLANRTILESAPLYFAALELAAEPHPYSVAGLAAADLAGRCRTCANLLTIADRGRTCRQCLAVRS